LNRRGAESRRRAGVTNGGEVWVRDPCRPCRPALELRTPHWQVSPGPRVTRPWHQAQSAPLDSAGRPDSKVQCTMTLANFCQYKTRDLTLSSKVCWQTLLRD